MRRSKLFCLTIVIAVAGLISLVETGPLRAATISNLTFPSYAATKSVCAESAINFSMQFTGTNDDGGGLDYFAYVAYEGNGTPIGYGFSSLPLALGTTYQEPTTYNGLLSLGSAKHLVDLAIAPVSLKVFDVTGPASGGTNAEKIAQAEASPLLGQASFDPRTNADLKNLCANLPYATVAIPALSPVGLAALIGLLALGAVALLRRRV